jgi:hypothetical protein
LGTIPVQGICLSFSPTLSKTGNKAEPTKNQDYTSLNGNSGFASVTAGRKE